MERATSQVAVLWKTVPCHHYGGHQRIGHHQAPDSKARLFQVCGAGSPPMSGGVRSLALGRQVPSLAFVSRLLSASLLELTSWL
jgi:hypothetical protein